MPQGTPQNPHGKAVWCSGCRFSFSQLVSRPFLEQKWQLTLFVSCHFSNKIFALILHHY